MPPFRLSYPNENYFLEKDKEHPPSPTIVVDGYVVIVVVVVVEEQIIAQAS